MAAGVEQVRAGHGCSLTMCACADGVALLEAALQYLSPIIASSERTTPCCVAIATASLPHTTRAPLHAASSLDAAGARRILMLVIDAIFSCNYLCLVDTGRSDNEKSLTRLEVADRAYAKALELVDVAGREETEVADALAEIERLYTHTLFYLAQVHGAMNNPEQSAHYCEMTLIRQLPSALKSQEEHEIDEESAETTGLAWGNNATSLAKYARQSPPRCSAVTDGRAPTVTSFPTSSLTRRHIAWLLVAVCCPLQWRGYKRGAQRRPPLRTSPTQMAHPPTQLALVLVTAPVLALALVLVLVQRVRRKM